MKYKLQEVNFEIQLTSDMILRVTNTERLKNGFDYDDVEIKINYLGQEQKLAVGGYAFEYGRELFAGLLKPCISFNKDLFFTDNKKAIVDSDDFYKFVLVGQKDYALVLYQINNRVFFQVVKVETDLINNEVVCKIELLYNSESNKELFSSWKDINKKEYIPRLELERYLIQHAEIRERYKNLEEIDVTL